MFSVSPSNEYLRDRFCFATGILGLKGTVNLGPSNMKVTSGSEWGASYDYFIRGYMEWIKPISEKKGDEPSFDERLDVHYFHLDYLSTNISLRHFLSMFRGKHGNFLSIDTGWENHAIGINFITEEQTDGQFVTHMIVVNAGEPSDPAIKDEFLNNSVQCYTLSHPLKEDFLTNIYSVCKGSIARSKAPFFAKSLSSNIYGLSKQHYVRETFHDMLDDLKAVRNLELTAAMPKAMQKALNCGIANSNPAMHFNLATQIMRRNKEKSLLQCYDETLLAYKQVRINARVDALKTLLAMEKDFNSKKQWHAIIFEALAQFAAKEKRKESKAVIQSMDGIFKMMETEFPSQYESIKTLLSTFEEGYENLIKSMQEMTATKVSLEIKLHEMKNIKNPSFRERRNIKALKNQVAELRTQQFFCKNHILVTDAYREYTKPKPLSLESKAAADFAPVVLHTTSPPGTR